jgi:hypothetical protein
MLSLTDADKRPGDQEQSMRRFVQMLAVSGAVTGLGLSALPATASTLGPSAVTGHAHAALTPAQKRNLARAVALNALLGKRGSITGVVRSPGGVPAPNVCVRAIGQRATRTAYSRPGGRFFIAGLPQGSYVIEYRGCSPIGRYTGQWYGGLTQRSATKVAVTGPLPVQLAPVTLAAVSPRYEGPAAGPRPSIQAQLKTFDMDLSAGRPLPASLVTGRAPARISGRVTSRAGRPLAKICVMALKTDGNIFTGITSAAGTYSLPVPSGYYRVDFLPSCAPRGNYAPQLWKGAGSFAQASVLRVKPHQAVRHIDAVLGVGAEISGRVRSGPDVHASLGGICVNAVGTGGQYFFFGFAVTRPDGTFLLPDLATGRYSVSFFPCSLSSPFLPAQLRRPVPVTDGKITSGVDAYLQLGGSITGVVRDAHGHPLAGICANAPNISPTSGFFAAASTDKTGTYRILGLVTGRYQVSFSTGCRNSGPYAPTTVPAPVQVLTGKTTAGVNATMQFDGSMSGVVRNAGGQPLAGICVLAQGTNNPGFASATTSANGTYLAKDMPPGNYAVEFVPGGAFSSCGNKGNYLPVAPLATIASQATTTVNAVLPAGGVISGVVTDSHGRPVPGVCVFSSSSNGGQVSTGPDGSYQLTQLFSGSYFVGFAGGCGNRESVAWQDYHGDPTFAAPLSVPVTAGKTTPGIDASMRPGRRRGRIRPVRRRGSQPRWPVRRAGHASRPVQRHLWRHLLIERRRLHRVEVCRPGVP